MLGLRVRGIGATLFFDKKTKVLKQRQREDYSVVWNQNKKVSPAGAPQAGSAVERWAVVFAKKNSIMIIIIIMIMS